MWITIIGLFAAVGTTGAFLPQAVKTIRTKQTRDLSLSMFVMLVVGIIGWVIYGILIQDLPVIIANSAALLFNIPILFLKIKYK